MDSLSGQIYLTSLLDYESIKFYEYIVKAKDVDSLTGEALIKLYVLDSNDVAPTSKDTNPLKLYLNSNFTIPQFIHKFEVFDPDTVSNLPNKDHKFYFEMLQGDSTLFELDPINGVLSLQRIMDLHEIKQLTDSNSLVKFLNISISDGLFKTLVGCNLKKNYYGLFRYMLKFKFFRVKMLLSRFILNNPYI